MTLFLLLALPVSCSSSGAPRGTPGYVLVEEPGAQLVRLPCHVTQQEFNGLLIASFDDPGAPKSRLPYGGISGSPVYAADGQVLGGTPNAFLANGWPGFLVRPSSDWDAVLRIGRSLGTQLEDSGALLPVDPELGPGRKLGAYLVWGDAYAGGPGALSLRDGREVVLFSHDYQYSEVRGPCVFALIRSPVVAFAPDDQSVEMIYAPGPVVGTATYDDFRGVYGLLGVAPPHVRLSVIVEARGLRRTVERNYCIAKHPSLCSEGFGWAVTTALARFALDHTLGEASVRVECDGELLEDRTVRVTAAHSLAETIGSCAQEAAAGHLLQSTDVRVVIKVSYPASATFQGAQGE